MMTCRNWIAVLVGAFVLCETAAADTKGCESFRESDFTAIGRYLADMELSKCSKLYHSKKQKREKKDALVLKHKVNSARMLDWWRKNAKGLPKGDVFYPFGGPDIANPVMLFPEARTFTLFGLESIGSVPKIRDYLLMAGRKGGSTKMGKIKRSLLKHSATEFLHNEPDEARFQPLLTCFTCRNFSFLLGEAGRRHSYCAQN